MCPLDFTKGLGEEGGKTEEREGCWNGKGGERTREKEGRMGEGRQKRGKEGEHVRRKGG